MAHESRKKPLDLGGNPGHATLGSGFGLSQGCGWVGVAPYSCATWCSLNCNTSSTSAALAEAFTLLSVILVVYGCRFYRATLCVSAVFAVVRCPSVRPSCWWIVSTRLKILSNFLFAR